MSSLFENERKDNDASPHADAREQEPLLNAEASEEAPATEKGGEETVSTVYIPSRGSTFTYSDGKAGETPKRKTKGSRIALTAIFLALCLILGVVGGASGMMIALLRSAENGAAPTGDGDVTTEDPNASDETVTLYKGPTVNVVTLPEDGVELSVAQIYAKVVNSVVAISTSAQMTSSFYGGFYVTKGAGSGVILSEEGHIVTNYHVVEDATEITVTMFGGKEYTARYLDGDKAADIALLKIEPEERITPVEIGSSDGLAIGQDVVAIGNPLGTLPGTVTDGIISALDRVVEIEGYSRSLIQTNAAISPGNSGGGLFDRYGRLCGIVNAKESSEGVEGLGFAIPIDDVFDLLVEIIEEGYIHDRAVLNLDVQRVGSANEAFYLYRNQNIGLYITASYYGEDVDVRAGDRICSVNGIEINFESDLHTVLSELAPGDEVVLTLGRTEIVSSGGGWGTYTEKQTNVTVTLIEYVPSSSVTFN